MSSPVNPPPEAPTCPRHPGVVSYVRCTRCGRPACPQCQRQAPVGVHCVDCVRESARTAPRPRSSLGVPTAGSLGGAPVTVALVVACVVVYLLQMSVPGIDEHLEFLPALSRHEPWRFVTAAFLHGGVTHILFNMYALWVVGQDLERVLGWARYLALYLVCAVGGSVGYLLFAQATASPSMVTSSAQAAWWIPTVGASGAVFGLFGAQLVIALRARLDVRPLLVVLAINLVIGFTVPSIAWQAHVGGLVTGAVLALLLWSTRSRARVRWQWPGIAAVLLVLVVLAVVKYGMSPEAVGWGGTIS